VTSTSVLSWKRSVTLEALPTTVPEIVRSVSLSLSPEVAVIAGASGLATLELGTSIVEPSGKVATTVLLSSFVVPAVNVTP